MWALCAMWILGQGAGASALQDSLPSSSRFVVRAVQEIGSQGRGESRLLHPLSLAADQGGALYVLDGGTRRVTGWAADGSPLWETDGRDLGGPGLLEPVQLIGGDGFFVYCLDRGQRALLAFGRDGALRGTVVLPGAPDPLRAALLPGGRWAALDGTTGDLLVLDRRGDLLWRFRPEATALDLVTRGEEIWLLVAGAEPRVVVHDLFGGPRRSIPLRDPAGRPLGEPVALATDDAGRLYIADRGAREVWIFDSWGHPMGGLARDFPWAGLKDPRDIVIVQGDLVVADAGRVVRISLAFR